MHKVLDEDTIKSKILPPNCLWQNVAMFQKATWRKLFHAFSTSRKPLVDGLLRLRFHDVVLVDRVQHAPQPFVLAVVNVRPFGVVAHLRVHAI